MRQTLILIGLYIIWLALGLAFYFMYITSMATSLGIPDRPWVMNDLAEGLPIAMIAAVVLTAVSWGITMLIRYILK
ncbi:MAG: hypothetical protein ACRBBN_20715 [Methyloligellaceae bacterium]